MHLHVCNFRGSQRRLLHHTVYTRPLWCSDLVLSVNCVCVCACLCGSRIQGKWVWQLLLLLGCQPFSLTSCLFTKTKFSNVSYSQWGITWGEAPVHQLRPSHGQGSHDTGIFKLQIHASKNIDMIINATRKKKWRAKILELWKDLLTRLVSC